ncbi:MAG: cyclic nucleotide-binding domain-containing protein [Rhizobiaceae bacterium]
MSLDSDIQLLTRVKLFEGFTHDQLRLLAFGAEALTVGHGTRLYRRDELAQGGFVVVRGKIELLSGLNDSIISTHSAGSLIGEMALISETRHAATAVATEHSEILKIPRALFMRMLEEYPELAELLQLRIMQSMDEFMEQLDRIKAKLDHATDLANRPKKTVSN